MRAEQGQDILRLRALKPSSPQARLNSSLSGSLTQKFAQAAQKCKGREGLRLWLLSAAHLSGLPKFRPNKTPRPEAILTPVVSNPHTPFFL